MYVYILVMLTKRTNILFSQDTWDQLTALAAKRKQSVGSVVRQAVIDRFNLKAEKKVKKTKVDNPLLELSRLAKKYKTPPLTAKEIKAYINAGRK